MNEWTGCLKTPEPEVWADTLLEIVAIPIGEREAARERARKLFGMDAMAHGLGNVLQETVLMGNVEVFGVGTLGVMLFGFLVAYLSGPFIFPASLTLNFFVVYKLGWTYVI